MKLQTVRFGELDIREEDVYEFPTGVPGFEKDNKFILLEVKEHEPFSYLQSLTNQELAFVVIDPFVVHAQYEFVLAEEFIEDVQIGTGDSILIRAIVSVRNNLDDATVNLVAPIVLNVHQRRGKQIVLTKGDYSTKHRLFTNRIEE